MKAMGDRREVTVRIAGGPRTLRFNLGEKSHEAAWEALDELTDEDTSRSDVLETGLLRHASADGSGRDAIEQLRDEWTQTGERLSKSTVLREVLRREAQREAAEEHQ